MSRRFHELGWQATSMGELVLRRRWDATFGKDVYEIKLNDEFLMSSLFTVAEEELARLALGETSGSDLDVVVGGLGLGYTAATVLESPDVRSLIVVEALGEVINWHRAGLVPVGSILTGDSRCTLVHGDFFAMFPPGAGLDVVGPDQRFDAVVVDIDHSPRHLLNAGHAGFYQADGMRGVADRLRPGGVFALWSNEPPDEDFMATLSGAFTTVRAEIVGFDNPLQGREATNTVYLAKGRRVDLNLMRTDR